MYKLSAAARFVKVYRLKLVGNTEQGGFIILTNAGYELLQKIREGFTPDIEQLDGNLKDLINGCVQIGVLYDDEKPEQKNTGITSAYLHVNNTCNMHCIGCYSNDGERNKKDNQLPTEKVITVLDKLRSLGVDNLMISGGEPTLRPDLGKIIKHAGSIGISQMIIGTNGTTYSQELADTLKDNNVIVSISIDGICPDLPDMIRDAGSYPGVMENIKKYISNGNIVRLLPTIHSENYDKTVMYLQLAQTLQVPINFSLLTCNDPGNDISRFVLTKEKMTAFIQQMNSFGTSSLIEDTPADLQSLSFHTTCGAGRNMISVDSLGNVFPCHMLQSEAFKVGNILTDSEDEILRKCSECGIVCSSVETVEKCKACQFRYFCRNGCKARAYYSSGEELNHPDMYCESFAYNFSLLKPGFDQIAEANGITDDPS